MRDRIHAGERKDEAARRNLQCACARRSVSKIAFPSPLPQRRPRVHASWDILKTLSDPTRVRLLALVAREELSVAELQEILGMGQSRISSQLALLRQVNLVSDRREGKKAFYSLRAPLPAKTLALLRSALDSVGAGRS